VAQIHTKPETVTEFNIKWLTELVNTGKANFYTTMKKKRDKDTGEEIEVKKKTNLQYGSIVKGTDLIHGDFIVRGNIELKKDKKGKLIIPEDCEGIIEVKTGKELLKKGDKLVRDGKYVEDLKYPEKKLVTLKIGDVVDRQLQKGDIVLLNRQPTLHKGSMLAMEVVPMYYRSFRFNLAATKSFNADFDGDEIGITV
jgi:DNA-directed RNA polymerase beta' subunit